jgi:hypothetical protein
MSDREKTGHGKPVHTDGPTWPKSVDAVTTPAPDAEGALPYLRRPDVPERKVTLRDLPVPTPNRKDTIRYQDQLPPSDPPPPPDPGDADATEDELTRLRLAEPIPFYIERDSVPAPDPLDDAPTTSLDPLGDATTRIKSDHRPSAMNFGKIAAPRFAAAGEPVKITTAKPSAMRLNRVEARADATTDAPVETPGRAPRPSLSGQRLHRALPVFTGVAFVAIGAATTVILLRGGGPETQAETPVTPNVATKVVPAPAGAAARPAPLVVQQVPSAGSATPPTASSTKPTHSARPFASVRRSRPHQAPPASSAIPDESPF